MTRPGVIFEEPPQQCDLCNRIRELRPYGPHGEAVCFDCMMLDEPAAERAFRRRMGFAASGGDAGVQPER